MDTERPGELMKVVCAWCAKALRIICPTCGRELTPAAPDSPKAGLLTCVHEIEPIYLDPDEMKTSHGICDTCAAAMTVRRAWADLQTPEDIANQQAQVEPGVVSIEAGKEPTK